jgi:hypothetical protein
MVPHETNAKSSTAKTCAATTVCPVLTAAAQEPFRSTPPPSRQRHQHAPSQTPGHPGGTLQLPIPERVLHAQGFEKLCSSSGVAKGPHFTLLRSHHESDGFATLAKAFESLRHLPLKVLDVHIIKISNNPDLREMPHDVFKRSLQTQSKQERPNRVTLSDTSGGPQELKPLGNLSSGCGSAMLAVYLCSFLFIRHAA